MAAKHLTRQGYFIWHRNWRCKYGELDIVAEGKRELIFVEVKSRTSENSDPDEAIDYKKERRLKMLATIYRHKHSLRIKRTRIKHFRFDSIGIIFSVALKTKLVHKENIFSNQWTEV